jgi:galactokinase
MNSSHTAESVNRLGKRTERLFQKIFGVKPTTFSMAPGRLELLGNYTDFNNGLVMALAIDRHICMAARPRQDGQIRLASSSFPSVVEFSPGWIEKDPSAPWANYSKGVLRELRDRGIKFGGFDAVIGSTLPIGAGMSSSAALEAATALTVGRLYPYRLAGGEARPEGVFLSDTQERMALAALCQAAENKSQRDIFPAACCA